MIHRLERNEAVERLVREEGGRIFRFLKALRVPPANREDLFQAGLVLLLQKWDAVDDPFSWLLGALRNLHRTQIRDRCRREKLCEASAHPPSPSMIPMSATACTSELRIDLTRWLLALPRQQRVLVVGLVLFDEPLDEMARRAGVKPASVQTLKARSLKRLRSMAVRSGAVRRADADPSGCVQLPSTSSGLTGMPKKGYS